MRLADLRRLTFGYRATRAVMAGVALGVFDALGDGARSISEVADACGLHPEGCRALLDALASIDVLTKEGAHFANTDTARRALTRDGVATRRHVILHDLWSWAAWARLEESLRDGAPLPDRTGDPFLSDPRILARFFPNLAHAMAETSRSECVRLARRLSLRGDERLLDLGGGIGNFSIELAQRHPGLRCWVVDLPPVAKEAETCVANHDLGHVIRVHAADFRTDPLDPEGLGFDVVLLSRIVMGLDDSAARGLLERAREVMVAGARVVLHEFRSSEATPCDPVSALLNLDMLLLTGGKVRSPAELLQLLDEAGFEKVDAKAFGRRAVLVEGKRGKAS